MDCQVEKLYKVIAISSDTIITNMTSKTLFVGSNNN